MRLFLQLRHWRTEELHHSAALLCDGWKQQQEQHKYSDVYDQPEKKIQAILEIDQDHSSSRRKSPRVINDPTRCGAYIVWNGSNCLWTQIRAEQFEKQIKLRFFGPIQRFDFWYQASVQYSLCKRLKTCGAKYEPIYSLTKRRTSVYYHLFQSIVGNQTHNYPKDFMDKVIIIQIPE